MEEKDVAGEELVERAADEETSDVTLPDVPTAEPTGDGPAQKKQKSYEEEKF